MRCCCCLTELSLWPAPPDIFSSSWTLSQLHWRNWSLLHWHIAHYFNQTLTHSLFLSLSYSPLLPIFCCTSSPFNLPTPSIDFLHFSSSSVVTAFSLPAHYRETGVSLVYCSSPFIIILYLRGRFEQIWERRLLVFQIIPTLPHCPTILLLLFPTLPLCPSFAVSYEACNCVVHTIGLL